MSLKDVIANLFGFDTTINNLLNRANTCEVKLSNTEKNLESKTDKVKLLGNELDLLSKQYFALLNKEDDPLAKELNNKYPKSDIEYRGRTFIDNDKRIPIDVRLLITPQDFHIHNLIDKHKLHIKESTYEEDVVKIYNWIKTNYYKYTYDSNNYQVSEFWEFPFEILERKEIDKDAGFDCDSWAHFQLSFYRAAGLPAHLGRVVVGDTKIGGHSTVYVYSKKTGKWHHLNSTYGGNFQRKTTLSDFYTSKDAQDKDVIGIYRVWHSNNDLYAWSTFETDGVDRDNLFEYK